MHANSESSSDLNCDHNESKSAVRTENVAARLVSCDILNSIECMDLICEITLGRFAMVIIVMRLTSLSSDMTTL